MKNTRKLTLTEFRMSGDTLESEETDSDFRRQNRNEDENRIRLVYHERPGSGE